jgi:hypothetical protein
MAGLGPAVCLIAPSSAAGWVARIQEPLNSPSTVSARYDACEFPALRGLRPDVLAHFGRVRHHNARVDRLGDIRSGICHCRMDRPGSNDENEGGYDHNGKDGAHWSSPFRCSGIDPGSSGSPSLSVIVRLRTSVRCRCDRYHNKSYLKARPPQLITAAVSICLFDRDRRERVNYQP